jgi:hypothetical protein
MFVGTGGVGGGLPEFFLSLDSHVIPAGSISDRVWGDAAAIGSEGASSAEPIMDPIMGRIIDPIIPCGTKKSGCARPPLSS